MDPVLKIVATLCDAGVAGALVAAALFWWRASRVRPPPSEVYDVRPSLQALQAFARAVDRRGQLNARAGVCVAVAAARQAGATATFHILRSQL